MKEIKNKILIIQNEKWWIIIFMQFRVPEQQSYILK